MNKTKVKNVNEAKIEKLVKLFGKELIIEEDNYFVPYEVTETEIKLGKKLKATFTKDVEDMDGYELLKNITIVVTCEAQSLEFTIHWTEDHGNVWIAQRLVNALIAVPRTKRVGSGLSAEDKAKLKAELARYKEEKKAVSLET